MGALKESQAKLFEQLKEVVKVRDSSEASLKTTKKQAKDLRKQLHCTEINLTTKKQLVTELRKAKEAVQMVKESSEVEKQADGGGDSSQTHRGTLCCMQGVLWYLLG